MTTAEKLIDPLMEVRSVLGERAYERLRQIKFRRDNGVQLTGNEQMYVYALRSVVDGKLKFGDKVIQFEKALIQKALDDNNGNQKQTAKALDIPRSTLLTKIKRLKPQPEDSELIQQIELAPLVPIGLVELYQFKERLSNFPHLLAIFEIKLQRLIKTQQSESLIFEIKRLRNEIGMLTIESRKFCNRIGGALRLQGFDSAGRKKTPKKFKNRNRGLGGDTATD